MFGPALAAAVTLLQVYVFWRLASLSLFQRGWARAVLGAVG